MKGYTICFFLSVSILLGSAGIGFSQSLKVPEREIHVKGDVDPFRLELYRKKGFKEPYATFSLKPGKRMLKIPNLEWFPGSVFLGSKVGVLLFFASDYHSNYRRSNEESTSFYSTEYGHSTNVWLVPFTRLTYSSPEIKIGKGFRDVSMIIYRKDIGDFLGVMNYNQFYPLPEEASERSIVYHKIDPVQLKMDFENIPPALTLVVGGDGSTSLHGHPKITDLRVTVTGEWGVRILPQGNEGVYQLRDLKIGVPVSIKLEYLGPIQKDAYYPPKKHRAPPFKEQKNQVSRVGQVLSIKIPPKESPDITGEWSSSIHRIYRITQEGNRFTWRVVNHDEVGNGIIRGKNVEATWTGPRGRGSAKGTIISFDKRGRPLRIRWNNGVIFFRK